MSVVDQWDWSKVRFVEEENDEAEIDVNTKIQMALYDFENSCNIIPNRIVMGYNLLNKLIAQLFDTLPMKAVEDMKKEPTIKYEGIPVVVDYNNPDNLEVGYMAKWMEAKKG